MYGLFNASISADRLSNKYIFNNTTNSWDSIHKKSKKSIVEGSIVEFITLHCQYSQGVLFIEGDI